MVGKIGVPFLQHRNNAGVNFPIAAIRIEFPKVPFPSVTVFVEERDVVTWLHDPST